MIEFEEKTSQLKIIIPISGEDELARYRRGIMGVLRKIEVNNCDEALKENLKSVFELLSHLVPDNDSLIDHKKLLTQTKRGKLKKDMLQS